MAFNKADQIANLVNKNLDDFQETAHEVKESIVRVHGEQYLYRVSACADLLGDIGIALTLMDRGTPDAVKQVVCRKLANSMEQTMLAMTGYAHDSKEADTFNTWVETLTERRDKSEKVLTDQIKNILTGED